VTQLRDFIAAHALITTEDADAFLRSHGTPCPRKRDRELAALCASGDLVRVQRGLYARNQHGSCKPDSYVIASHLAPDAILGLHSALEARGVIAPASRPCVYFTRLDNVGRGPVWHGTRMVRISHPVPLTRAGRALTETELVESRGGGQPGGRMRVTTIERAAVDIMDRPRLTGDWPEILQILDALPSLDLDRVINYVGALGNATTAAKAGWVLERNQQRLGVSPNVLCRLERMRPRGPHYLSRSHRVSGRYVARWNLVVPATLS
jgi:predicted transcriptional regulator of viral defense system